MEIKELEAKIKILEDKVTRLQDIEDIKKLQRAYAYYIERFMGAEAIDMFSDDAESIDTSPVLGTYLGKEGVRKHFAVPPNIPPGHLHLLNPSCAIIDIDPDGKTAKGRWYAFGCYSLPLAGVLRAFWAMGIYENEYVKENGKWLFKKVHYYPIFTTPYEDGWVKTPSLVESIDFVSSGLPKGDLPSTFKSQYPAKYDIPFHYKHPITGK